jgi:hypothetical protein
MAAINRKLTRKQWEELEPKCVDAALQSTLAATKWAEIAAEAVVDASSSEDKSRPKADWRWLLTDLRDRCIDNGIECPYAVKTLVQYAETYEAVDGDFDRNGAAFSALVEGRHLDNLIAITEMEQNLKVTRMRAHVHKEATDDERPVDEIEAEMKAERDSEKERKARKSETDKIAEWPLDKTDKLVAMIEEYNGAFRKAIKRHEIAGREFDANATGMATHTTSLLHKTLRKLKLTGSDAEAA